jgi:hypothetical protein
MFHTLRSIQLGGMALQLKRTLRFVEFLNPINTHGDICKELSRNRGKGLETFLLQRDAWYLVGIVMREKEPN